MALLDKERALNLYNADDYKQNTTNWEDDVSQFRANAFIQALQEGGLLGKVNSITDVGCGSGGVLAHIARDPRLSGACLTGIDISQAAIELSRRLSIEKGVGDRVMYEMRSVTDLESSQRVTVMSLIHVLEHCPDMLEMLDALADRSDYQYINVPLEYNLFYALRSGVPAAQYERYGHLHFFDEKFLLKWLSQNKYDVICKVYSQDYRVAKKGLLYNVVKFESSFVRVSVWPFTDHSIPCRIKWRIPHQKARVKLPYFSGKFCYCELRFNVVVIIARRQALSFNLHKKVQNTCLAYTKRCNHKLIPALASE